MGMERWRDGEMERWRDGEMERWRDEKKERWRDEKKERWRDEKKERWRDEKKKRETSGLGNFSERYSIQPSPVTIADSSYNNNISLMMFDVSVSE
jgi:hypothetical protein